MRNPRSSLNDRACGMKNSAAGKVGRIAAFFISVTALFAFACAPALASSELFTPPPETDMARAWLDLLFRGVPLPDNLAYNMPHLGAVAGALHKALGIYSIGMLVLAGFFLLYGIAVMVIETAHRGIPFGRHNLQLTAPIRLVVAIGLLVPVGSGLNTVQYLVVWLAKAGSALASNVWDAAADNMRGSFSSIAMPKGPDVGGFVVKGIEMELCRALYQHNFDAYQNDPGVHAAGNIGGLIKLTRTRFAEETWQYTNRLHASVPLCGAYRFATAEPSFGSNAATGTIESLSGDLAAFSRAETGKLVTEAQAFSGNAFSAFLGQAPSDDIRQNIASLIAAHQTTLDNKLSAVIADGPALADQALLETSDAGWVAAGGFVLQLARLQQIYGSLAEHALPAAQTPVLAQIDLLHPTVAEAAATDPLLHSFSSDALAPLFSFYTQTASSVGQEHLWLDDRVLADMPMVLANSFDLRDQLAASGDSSAVSSLFAHVLNDGAVVYGVWDNAAGAAFAATTGSSQSLLALPSAMQNAVTALTEFGQRQTALGNYLFGIASPDLAPPGTLAYALLLGAIGLAFMASGFALVFLLPLLPFFRFFLGILVWLLGIFEAIVAVPIMALAYLNVTGEGVSASAARQAAILGLNIMVRPVLTLFGFVVGLLLFTVAMVFLGMIFQQLTQLTTPASGDMFVTINVALTLLYTILACVAANAAFKGIALLPEQALKWLSGLMVREHAEGATAAASSSASAASLSGYSGPLLTARAEASASANAGNRDADTGSRAFGLKNALFPSYRDRETPGEPLKAITSSESREKPGRETPFAASPHMPIRADDRKMQKPDKRRPEKPDAKKDDVPSVAKADDPAAKEPDDK